MAVARKARALSTGAALIMGAVLSQAACEGTPEVDAATSPDEPIAEARKALDPHEGSAVRFGVIPLHAGFSPDPRVVSGEALGQIPARTLHRKCRGWIGKTPDYLLEADTAFLRLYVLARSRSDIVLAVRQPDGTVICDDNRRGTTDAMIHGGFPIGVTQVWVGVRKQGGVAPYRLGFSEVKWKPSSIPLPDAD